MLVTGNCNRCCQSLTLSSSLLVLQHPAQEREANPTSSSRERADDTCKTMPALIILQEIQKGIAYIGNAVASA